MRERILIADHETTCPDLISKLQGFGFKLLKAENSAKALDILKTETVDLVLLNWQMPAQGGNSFIRKIVDLKESIEIIVMIPRESMNSAIESIRQGASDFVILPVEYKELEARILRVLSSRPLKQMAEYNKQQIGRPIC